MWTKIKAFFSKAGGYIVAGLTALVGVLLLVITGKNKKISKQSDKIDELDKEVKVEKVKAEQTEKAHEIEKEVTDVAIQSQKEETKQTEEILSSPEEKQAEIYNDIINSFNGGGKKE